MTWRNKKLKKTHKILKRMNIERKKEKNLLTQWHSMLWCTAVSSSSSTLYVEKTIFFLFPRFCQTLADWFFHWSDQNHFLFYLLFNRLLIRSSLIETTTTCQARASQKNGEETMFFYLRMRCFFPYLFSHNKNIITCRRSTQKKNNYIFFYQQ